MKDSVMQKYLAKVRALGAKLNEQRIIVEYRRIPRDENEEPDLLSKLLVEELEQLLDEVYVQQIDVFNFEKPASIMQADKK